MFYRINRFLFLGISISVITIFSIISFVVDVGINSKYFIKRDLNRAYTYLIAGDCESYNNYLLYKESYKNKELEKLKKAGYNLDIDISNMSKEEASEQLKAYMAEKTISGDQAVNILSEHLKYLNSCKDSGIKEVKINKLIYKFFDDKAFVSIEIIKENKKIVLLNKKMVRSGLHWKIK